MGKYCKKKVYVLLKEFEFSFLNLKNNITIKNALKTKDAK